MADDPQDLFAITTLGRLTPGHDPDAVARSVSARFQLNPEQAERLIQSPTIIARNLTDEKARQYKRALLELGVMSRVLNMSTVAARSSTERPAPKAERVAAISALLAGVDREFQRPVRPATYYARGALVTLFSILVPVIYLGAVAGLLASAWFWVGDVPFPRNWWRAIAWVTAPVTLAIIALVLLRPIFRGYGKPARVELEKDKQTPLLALVTILCQRIGVPQPSSVYVDANVNAYVTPKGLTGIFTRRLELTIGLPLVTGMQAQQLASVIAHEFGHFAQPVEMFVSSVVNAINGWMYFSGFEGDPWEDRLDHWRRQEGLGIFWLPLTAALLSIFTVRWLMRRIFSLNLRVTGGFSRQMEFDADRYAIAAIGSGAFVQSEIRLRELIFAASAVEEINARAFEENRLLEDLPAVIARTRDGFRDDQLEIIERSRDDDQIHYWDTHPAGNDRIRAAKALAIADVAAGDFPAAWVMQDVPKLSRWATQILYQRDRGVTNATDLMVPNQQVLDLVEEQDAAWEAIERFFLNTATKRIYQFEPPADQDIVALDESALLEQLKAARPDYLETAKRYHDNMDLSDRIFVAGMYGRHDVGLEPGDFGLQDHDPRMLERRLDETLREVARDAEALGRVDRMYYRRAELAIAHLSPDDGQRAHRMLRWLRALTPARGPLERLQRYADALSSMLRIDSNDETLWQHMQPALLQFRDFSVQELNPLIERLNKIPNLLSSAHEDESLADYFATFGIRRIEHPESSDPAAIGQMSYQLHEKLLYQYFRVMGDLFSLCRDHWDTDEADVFTGTRSG